jgi:hypothetical protein
VAERGRAIDRRGRIALVRPWPAPEREREAGQRQGQRREPSDPREQGRERADQAQVDCQRNHQIIEAQARASDSPSREQAQREGEQRDARDRGHSPCVTNYLLNFQPRSWQEPLEIASSLALVDGLARG